MPLQKVRIQLLDSETGAVVQECDVMTAPDAVIFSDGKTLTQKLNEIELTPGPKGDKGDPGAPFQVKKIYVSVAAMNADFGGSDVATGEFVLIETGNVEDADNSKLYCKSTAAYVYLTDLSGAQGIHGPKGDKGETGAQGIQGVKGDKGDKGETGATGAKGATGAAGVQGVAGPQGPKGDTGAQGPKGDAGDTVKVGATPETAVQRKLFFKVVG